jgi:hypothetical protein
VCLCGLILLLHLQDCLVTSLVCDPVLALAVAVAVARSVARALLELRRPGAAAGAVSALVQLVPHIGVGEVSWHQSARDTTLAIDAGVHGLLLVHAES